MIKKVIIPIFFILFFTSCAYLPTEKLMLPPKLTKEQSAIYLALEDFVGTSNIKLKYPKSGDYRSAFVFYDLDLNGEDEAIAFYQTSNSSVTRMNILDKSEKGKWYSREDISGESSDVDFIDFCNISSKDELNIVVGWDDSLSVSNEVTIFSYEDYVLQKNLTEDYNEVVIDDIDKNGFDDVILLLYGRSYGNADAMLIGKDKDQIEVISQYHLYDNITSIEQIKVGKIMSGETALFIDEMVNRKYYTTEVLTVDKYNLISVLNIEDKEPDDEDEEQNSKEKDNKKSGKDREKNEDIQQNNITRVIPIFCQDADKDGIIEVPTITLLPGYLRNNEEREPIYLTNFNNIVNGKMQVDFSAAVNTTYGYIIRFPSRWVGNVTIVLQPETGEWKFVPYDRGFDPEISPLLRIKVYSQKDYRDKFDKDNFVLLIQRGLFEYYYSISNTKSDYSITQPELIRLFSLI